MKGQTATEYLIILAIVIVISLLTVNVLTDVLNLGSSDEKTELLQLQTKSVGINSYVLEFNQSRFVLRNNENSFIRIESLWVDDRLCLPHQEFQLNIGAERVVTCDNIFNTQKDKPDSVEVIYTEVKTGGRFSTSTTSDFIAQKDILLPEILRCTDYSNYFTATGYNRSDCEQFYEIDGCGSGTILAVNSNICWPNATDIPGTRNFTESIEYCENLGPTYFSPKFTDFQRDVFNMTYNNAEPFNSTIFPYTNSFWTSTIQPDGLFASSFQNNGGNSFTRIFQTPDSNYFTLCAFRN